MNNTINTKEFSKLIYYYWSNYYRNLNLEQFNKRLNEDIKGLTHEEVIQWLQEKNKGEVKMSELTLEQEIQNLYILSKEGRLDDDDYEYVAEKHNCTTNEIIELLSDFELEIKSGNKKIIMNRVP